VSCRRRTGVEWRHLGRPGSGGRRRRAIKADQVTQQQLALSEALVGWSEKYPDVEVRKSLPMGATVFALTEAAKSAELLVVGSRGRGGFRSLLLGSVSQGALAQATCTVAVVRGPSINIAV